MRLISGNLVFRDLRPQSIEKSQERCRLRLYEIYAWGGPFLIAGTAAILDLAAANSDSGFLRPRFCENTAWFSGKSDYYYTKKLLNEKNVKLLF